MYLPSHYGHVGQYVENTSVYNSKLTATVTTEFAHLYKSVILVYKTKIILFSDIFNEQTNVCYVQHIALINLPTSLFAIICHN